MLIVSGNDHHAMESFRNFGNPAVQKRRRQKIAAAHVSGYAKDGVVVVRQFRRRPKCSCLAFGPVIAVEMQITDQSYFAGWHAVGGLARHGMLVGKALPCGRIAPQCCGRNTLALSLWKAKVEGIWRDSVSGGCVFADCPATVAGRIVSVLDGKMWSLDGLLSGLLEGRCSGGRQFFAKILLWCGANPESPSRVSGMDMVSRAARGGRIGFLELFLSRGASPNKCGLDGFGPVHHAALKGHVDSLEILLSHGGAVSLAADGKWTPLLCAIRENRTDAVRFLLSAGARADEFEADSGLDAINRASARGNGDIVSLLIAFGANPGAPGTDGWFPMHRAAGAAFLDVIRILHSAGADLMPHGPFDRTPVSVAYSMLPTATAVTVEELLMVLDGETQKEGVPTITNACRKSL